MLTLAFLWFAAPASAFEGQINISLNGGSQTNSIRYTIGSEHLRIETLASERPTPVDILELQSGAMTLLMPHNRSFVRLNPDIPSPAAASPGFPGMPPGIGPQPGVNARIGPATTGGATTSGASATPQPPAGLPPGVGPQPAGFGAGVGAAGMPAMPRMPMPTMNQKTELKPTGQTTNLLGYDCKQYELKQRGETMQIWATDQLTPYQPYLRSQPRRYVPTTIQEQWPRLVAQAKLFPMLVTLRYDHGPERYRFEVKSVVPEKITEPNKELFQPPHDYHEVQPTPF